MGVTTSVRKRKNGHYNPSRSDTSYRANWLRSQIKKGTLPVLEVIEQGQGEGWTEREMYWIALYREQGTRLVNTTDGGEGRWGGRPSQETRLKMSLAHKGIPLTEEHKLKLSIANKGQVVTPEQREHLSKINTGKKHSEETKRLCAIASAKKGPVTDEMKARISKTLTGRKHSPERIAAVKAGMLKKKIERELADPRRQMSILENSSCACTAPVLVSSHDQRTNPDREPS